MLRGISFPWHVEDSLTMGACSQTPLRCQVKSVKVLLIENSWIGFLKNLFMVCIVVYNW